MYLERLLEHIARYFTIDKKSAVQCTNYYVFSTFVENHDPFVLVFERAAFIIIFA
jgi:hypothetical protein